jgi:hypothetical protein
MVRNSPRNKDSRQREKAFCEKIDRKIIAH